MTCDCNTLRLAPEEFSLKTFISSSIFFQNKALPNLSAGIQHSKQVSIEQISIPLPPKPLPQTSLPLGSGSGSVPQRFPLLSSLSCPEACDLLVPAWCLPPQPALELALAGAPGRHLPKVRRVQSLGWGWLCGLAAPLYFYVPRGFA